MADIQIQSAVHALQQGGIVAYPTEAVYGLGCDPRNTAAITRLLRLKQRSANKGLILIAADVSQIKAFVNETDDTVWRRVLASWPGPVTWLMRARPDVRVELRGEHDTIAVRVTDHPIARQLCTAFGGALVSTSANLTTQEPARQASEVVQMFGQAVDVVVEGNVGTLRQATEIRHANTGDVIRPAV